MRKSLLWSVLIIPFTLHPAVASVTIDSVGLFTFAAPLSGPSELSGMTYNPTTGRFLAVSDQDNFLYSIDIDIDPNTGAIQDVVLDSALELKDAAGNSYPSRRDFEAVTYDPFTDTVFTLPEPGPAVQQHSLTTGNLIDDSLNLHPAVSNADHEALTGNTLAGLWTSNVEPTSNDRSPGVGRPVRMTHYNDVGNVTEQYFYAPGITGINGGDSVKEILLLPDGTLLVLERINSSPQRLFAIFAIDATSATDVSNTSTPDGSEVYATKSLLWSGYFDYAANGADLNFEGLTLGPQLANGGYALLIVADNGGPTAQTNHSHFYALTLNIPEPATLGIVSLSSLLLLRRHTAPRR